jgi:hypothetical protein
MFAILALLLAICKADPAFAAVITGATRGLKQTTSPAPSQVPAGAPCGDPNYGYKGYGGYCMTCCNMYDWCGNNPMHCGDGCQPKYSNPTAGKGCEDGQKKPYVLFYGAGTGTIQWPSSQQTGSVWAYYDAKNVFCPKKNPWQYNAASQTTATDSVPFCALMSTDRKSETLRQLGSNNAVSIVANVLTGWEKGSGTIYPVPALFPRLCGKKVNIYRNYNYTAAMAAGRKQVMSSGAVQYYTPNDVTTTQGAGGPSRFGELVTPPNGGSFFVWDTCRQCSGGMKIRVSVSALKAINPDGCNLQWSTDSKVQGMRDIYYEVVDEQVIPFNTVSQLQTVPAPSST